MPTLWIVLGATWVLMSVGLTRLVLEEGEHAFVPPDDDMTRRQRIALYAISPVMTAILLGALVPAVAVVLILVAAALIALVPFLLFAIAWASMVGVCVVAGPKKPETDSSVLTPSTS